jgi:hypothetical protein
MQSTLFVQSAHPNSPAALRSCAQSGNRKCTEIRNLRLILLEAGSRFLKPSGKGFSAHGTAAQVQVACEFGKPVKQAQIGKRPYGREVAL